MSEKIIYLIVDEHIGVHTFYFWSVNPAPTPSLNPDDAIKYIRDDGEIKELLGVIKELLGVIKDCLSYADAQAVLKQGEAVELRKKCRAVIEKVEENHA